MPNSRGQYTDSGLSNLTACPPTDLHRSKRLHFRNIEISDSNKRAPYTERCPSSM